MEEQNELKRIELNPYRSSIQTPTDDARMATTLSEYASEGRWESLIDLCRITIFPFIEKFPNPGITGGGILAAFYYAAKAYKATGKDEEYIVCLKILYSMEPFAHAFGTNYTQYIENGSSEYQSLTKSHSIDYLNNLDVKGKIKKKGCFIATACYDSYDAPEVLVLRKFRDDVLLKSLLGKTTVSFYYHVSPPIADYISDKRIIKKLLKHFIIDPIVRLIKTSK